MRVLYFTAVWLGGVAANIMMSTYTQRNEDFKGQEVLVMAGNPVACGGQCLLHPNCGAYAFKPKQVPNCVLFVVSADKADSPQLGLYFSGISLTTGNFLLRVPTEKTQFSGLHDECEQSGAQLVLFPSVQRDLVTTQSHGKFYYDLQRENEDAVTFTTSDGTPVNSSLLNMSPEPGKTNLAPQCIATDYSGAFRMGNTWDLQGAIALCQYTQN